MYNNFGAFILQNHKNISGLFHVQKLIVLFKIMPYLFLIIFSISQLM